MAPSGSSTRRPPPSSLPGPEPPASFARERAVGLHFSTAKPSPKQSKSSNSSSSSSNRGNTMKRRKLEAFRATQLVLWRRRYFEGILRWEAALRLLFVALPKLVFRRVESARTVVAFFFVYVMLQALAILWGFLFNVGAVLGENMSTIITMPFVQALCVLVVYASVMGIVLSFGRATWILTWQSLQNFPLIRRIIACECRPQAVILTVAMPMLIILPSLIVVPSHCSSAALQGSSSLVQAMCEESYLKLLTDKHPVFQRALRISTAIAICQFIQLCLEILPRWRSALAGLSTVKTFLLGGWLLGMNFLGGLWTVEWSARHFNLKITPLSDLTNYQWEIFGMTLLVGWILWFLAITCFTFPNVKECDSNKKALSGFFERLKFTFVIGQGIVFFRACLHPNMGFVHAQLELTIINLLLPSIYVVSLICLRMVSLLSVRAVLIDGPLALGLAGVISVGSKMTEKPHVFVVVGLFLFDRFLRSEAASSLSEMGQTLQQMLQETSTDKRHPLLGHRTAKKFVYLAVAILLLFVGALSGFSILSVLQKSAKWFPDATSVEYEDNSIHIHHTGVVKLHLGLANKTNPAIVVDDPLYASCSNRWNGLSLIDLAFFAEAAYFDPLSNDTAEFISTIFDNELGDVHVHLPALNTKTGSKLDFFEAYIPKLNTSVISVRGTDIWRFTDFVEDVKMFFEPVVFSVLSSIFPTIRIWPDVTFSTLIELYSEMIGLFGLQHESWYYHELLDYVTSLTDRKVVLTGHSMGGGIARLVGSIVGTTSVTFSPPGFVQSYSKLVHHIGGTSMKVDRASLHHRSFAVVPEYDPITMIDAQAGMTQKISCDTPHLSMQLSCHMLEGTLCNLVEHCGSARHRISSCLFEHNIAGATEDMLPRVLATISKPEIYVSFAVSVSIALSMVLRRHHRKMRTPLSSPSHRSRKKSRSPGRFPHSSNGNLRPPHPSLYVRRNSII
ncbi:Transmembrane protein [Phytophthora cinnamomi]|uniref:Transmembrane protein n=1 Tax=Phytophthora cinnamomi TaxID=4785 RepID=UPI003559F815|nr:Transmembrane protein [Phytophthora cinnamomi]